MLEPCNKGDEYVSSLMYRSAISKGSYLTMLPYSCWTCGGRVCWGPLCTAQHIERETTWKPWPQKETKRQVPV